MIKQFKATWNTSWDGVASELIVGLDYFTDNIGYDDESRCELDALAIDEFWDFEKHRINGHTVERIA